VAEARDFSKAKLLLRYFPIFVDLDGRDVLIAGGGEKALQKLRLLTKTTARIRLVAEAITEEVAALARPPAVTLERRRFAPSDLNGAAIAIAANDDLALDLEVAAAAKAQGVPVNVVDGPGESTFIMPAIVDRDPVVVAVATGGAAPILAREIKSRIEAWLPAHFGRLAREAMGLRRRVQDAVADPVARRRTWETLLHGVWRSAVLAGDEAGARREFDRQIAAACSHQMAGSVTLIGCGPGEPDLLTLKAQQRLQEADVLVVDRLVNPAILEYARRDAVRIDAGKEPEGPSAAQDDINRTLVREALKGHRVARLKGGDAFIFGRAAEEMAAVRAAGIPVEVVPGVTAAHACAASVGLPLTLRQRVRQFAVVTGASAERDFDLDWSGLAKPGQAFAIYMGVRSAPRFRDELLAAGASPDTAVVIVENGTLASERAVATRLSHLDGAIATKGIRGPAIIFVGLDWEKAGLSRPDRIEVYEPAGGEARADGPPALSAPQG
jgi:uroporphyrin-III C-methyltransferase/precorrin-2 dehydrogenase/sirohydrochlorin ferrochelatase